jgi:hypothetical protein
MWSWADFDVGLLLISVEAHLMGALFSWCFVLVDERFVCAARGAG